MIIGFIYEKYANFFGVYFVVLLFTLIFNILGNCCNEYMKINLVRNKRRERGIAKQYTIKRAVGFIEATFIPIVKFPFRLLDNYIVPCK